jgi:translation elongation factor EF-Tu-like GTPase
MAKKSLSGRSARQIGTIGQSPMARRLGGDHAVSVEERGAEYVRSIRSTRAKERSGDTIATAHVEYQREPSLCARGCLGSGFIKNMIGCGAMEGRSMVVGAAR